MSGFCQRCYNKAVEAHRRKHGDNPRFVLDVNNMTFSCQIPLYETDDQGRPTVKIWDCESGISRVYSQQAWEKKKLEGA